MTEREFMGLWEPEELPACETGLALLKRFAEAHPDAFELERETGFVDLNRPELEMFPEWSDFANHCTDCADCNEE